MTNEQLEKGIRIRKRLEELTSQREYWANAESIAELELKNKSGGNMRNIERGLVDFPVMRALTLAKIESRISELNYEFSNL
jgi:hypothetical protein